MYTIIVLLRGINVGGHKKVPMAELRELLSNSGFKQVRTYIQSGNIVLDSDVLNLKDTEEKIQLLILSHFGFEVPVIAKTHEQLEAIFNRCPFSFEKKEESYFVILNNVPDSKSVSEAYQKTYENEEFEIIKDCLYFHSSVGYGRSKFNMNTFEKQLKVNATSRNYKTMVKLLSMSGDS